MRLNRRYISILFFALALALAACSPEARRERGGGAGGDPGNHRWPVDMHGESDPVRMIYHEMPLIGEGIQRGGGAGAIQPRP